MAEPYSCPTLLVGGAMGCAGGEAEANLSKPFPRQPIKRRRFSRYFVLGYGVLCLLCFCGGGGVLLKSVRAPLKQMFHTTGTAVAV